MKRDDRRSTGGQVPEQIGNIYLNEVATATLPRKLTRAVLGLLLTSTLSATLMSEKQPSHLRGTTAVACGKLATKCHVVSSIEKARLHPNRSAQFSKLAALVIETHSAIAKILDQPYLAKLIKDRSAQQARETAFSHSITATLQGIGVDITWTNCKAKVPRSPYGIVGVNHGSGFNRNTCLKTEAANFRNLSLYVNTDYSGIASTLAYQRSPKNCLLSDEVCLAYNKGYADGHDAVKYADLKKVHSLNWWVDVENGKTGNDWSSNLAANRSDLQGEIDAIKKYERHSRNTSILIGMYSTAEMWNEITGGWQNGLPNWVPLGRNSRQDAINLCVSHDFTHGGTVMVQNWETLDTDLICPITTITAGSSANS